MSGNSEYSPSSSSENPGNLPSSSSGNPGNLLSSSSGNPGNPPSSSSGNRKSLPLCLRNVPVPRPYTRPIEDSPRNYDPNHKKFIHNLLIFVIQSEEHSRFREDAVDILCEHLTNIWDLRNFRTLFSYEGAQTITAMLHSPKDFVVLDCFRIMKSMFEAYKDLFLTHFGLSGLLTTMLKHIWGTTFPRDVCIILRSFIQLASTQKVTEVFMNFEVLEKLCEAIITRIRIHDNNREVARFELDTFHMFRIKMANNYRIGFTYWLRTASEYEIGRRD